MKSMLALLTLLRQVPLHQRLLLAVLMLMSSVSEGLGLLLLVPLLNVLQDSGQTAHPLVGRLMSVFAATGIKPGVGGLLALFVILLCVRNAVQYARDNVSVAIQHRLVDTLRERCFKALLGAEWRWLASGRNSDHANLLLTDVNRVGMGMNFGLALLISLLAMLAGLTVAFMLSWSMTLLALGSGIVVLLILSRQRRRALSLGESLGLANRAMQATVQESLAGIKLTKILGNEKRHLRLFLSTVGRLRQQQLAFMISSSRARALYQTLGALLLAGYLYAGLTTLDTPVAELLTLVLIFGRLIPMISAAQQQHHHWLHAIPAVQETQRLLQQCHAVKEPITSELHESWSINEGIRLEAVSVRYEGREKAALDSISFCCAARTTTAIMGSSGSGKSTLADVVMGLLQPDGGRVLIDGRELVGEARLQWRKSVAYVPQDTFLFHDSVRNNLLWAGEGLEEQDLRLALQRAAADFVFSLPDGLDTVVGDGGIRLSGGERQRLALARALLKKPSLLILDEATSALDTENESRVRDAIENLHGDLTVLIIGHRLPTLEHADQVVIIDNGRVAAAGSWAEVKAQQRPAV